MKFFKRTCMFISVLLITGLFTACSAGTMGEEMGDGPENKGNLDLTPLKYLEQIFNSNSGQMLYRKSLAGSLFLSDNNVIRQNISENLNMIFLENIDALKSHSECYWADRDFNLSQLSEKLESEGSALAFDIYIENFSDENETGSVNSRTSAINNQCRIINESADIVASLSAISAVAGIYSAYDGYNQADYIKDINSIFRKILKTIEFIDKKNSQYKNSLISIERDINGIEDDVYKLSVLNNREDLTRAENRVNGFLLEISTIEGIDNAERLSMIKDFLLHGYEEMYIAAFQSALNVNTYINSRRSEDKRMPLPMSLSDMIFMVELSFIRLSFAPLFFKGEDLLNYRANIAKADLARAGLLKRSLSRAYNRISNNEYRDTVMTVIASWDITLMSHIQVVQDVDDAAIVEMESADNYYLGFGTFGNEDNNYGHLLTKNDPSFLVDTSYFEYGDLLSDVFDTGLSGDFAAGRYLRIVENGKNVMDPSGLGLTPVCMDFSQGVISPPKDKVYIDPVSGQFVLPRPMYWSRMESLENITSPEIGEGQPYTEFTGTCTSETFPDGKFGGGYRLYNYDYSSDEDEIKSHSASRVIYPFGKETKRNFNKGTISFWFKIACTATGWMWDNANFGRSAIEIKFDSEIVNFQIFYNILPVFNLIINGNLIHQYLFISQDVIHIFIIWDKYKKNSDKKSVRVFVDGKEIISTDSDFPDLSNIGLKIKILSENSAHRCNSPFSGVTKNHSSSSSTQIDNIQIWNDVVTEDPNIFYNNGYGREDALHAIYGPENDYKPSNVGVGYHYVR